jgi:DNA-binding CsgD family transcriptional regulator
MTADILAVVEASYKLEADDDVWVRGIAEAAFPLIDDGQGVVVAIYDSMDPARLRLSSVTSRGSHRVDQGDADRLVPAIPPSQVPRLYPPVPQVGWLAQTFPGRSVDARKLRELAKDYGQVMGVTCPAGQGRGVVLSVFSEEARTRNVSRASWLQLAVHVSNAARLRKTLGSPSPSLEPGKDDAVLTSAGQLVHADGAARALDARQALRNAARAVDRARSEPRRSEPEKALFSWKGLVDGRWSLVDQFDSDGRRFLVARRNDPAFRSPRALSPRERHVAALAAVGHPSKIIAYQLGVSITAANATLNRALKKLGLRSRADLARVAGVLDPWGDTSPAPSRLEGE